MVCSRSRHVPPSSRAIITYASDTWCGTPRRATSSSMKTMPHFCRFPAAHPNSGGQPRHLTHLAGARVPGQQPGHELPRLSREPFWSGDAAHDGRQRARLHRHVGAQRLDLLLPAGGRQRGRPVRHVGRSERARPLRERGPRGSAQARKPAANFTRTCRLISLSSRAMCSPIRPEGTSLS